MSSIRVYFLDFREFSQNVGGAVVAGRLWQQKQSFLDQMFGHGNARAGHWTELPKEKKVTFLVHGFNVSRPEGQTALSRLAKDLPSIRNDAIVVVTWPGDDPRTRVGLNYLCYVWRKNDANDTGREFERFCGSTFGRDTTLSFVSHSLGARVVMESVERLRKAYRIDQVCMMAAAIDDDSLADPGQYRQATTSAKRVAILASEQDDVLKYAYRPGQHPAMGAMTLGAGLLLTRKALGRSGPQPHSEKLFWSHSIPATVYHEQIPDDRNVGHGDYLDSDSQRARRGSSKRAKTDAAADFADQVLRGNSHPMYK